MDAVPGNAARRCLPLLIANQAGWEIRNASPFRATWDGGADPEAVQLDPPGADGWIHRGFGNGIITWRLPFLMRTPPGCSLLVRGPANRPKDGASPLEGIVETDWAVSPFAMNWKLTRPGIEVVFEEQEPICMVVPLRLNELESFDAELAPIDSDPATASGYATWARSRTLFIASGGRMLELVDGAARRGEPPTGTAWQRHYFHGRAPGGETGSDHRTRLRLAPFVPSAELDQPTISATQAAPERPAGVSGERDVAADGSVTASAGSVAAAAEASPVRFEELRPIAAGAIRWSDDALNIDIGDRDVRIEGDLVLARSVIADCDGRRTVRALVEQLGPDGAVLIEQLLSCGALVDCTESWRVFHRHGSVGSALGRPIDTAELLRIQRITFRPTAPTHERVPLQPLDSATQALTSRRQSAFPQADHISTSFVHLSSLLAAAYRFERDPHAVAASGGSVASAGALYPLILHVLIREAPSELAAGLWWYDPQGLQLELVRKGELEIADLFVPDPLSDALLATGEPVLFISADLDRPTRKYAARGYRYALMEAGAVMQTAALAAAELQLPLRPIGGFDDGRAHAFLELPAAGACLLALSLGC